MSTDEDYMDPERMSAGLKRLDALSREISGRGPAPSDEVLRDVALRLTRCPRCGGVPRLAPIGCSFSDSYCVSCDDCEDLAPTGVGDGIEGAIASWERSAKGFDPEAYKLRAWLSDNRESILTELVSAKRESRAPRLPQYVIDWAVEDSYILEKLIEEFEDDSAKQFRHMMHEMMRGKITADEFARWYEDNR